MEEELEKELHFHLDQYTAELIARGYGPEEARRQARIALGGPEQVKEDCRDARGTRWLEDLWQDFRHALRALRQRPGFASVAVLTLALGIGATTVMFTVINGVLLRRLPYPESDRLVTLHEQTKGQTDYRWGDLWAFAYPNYLDCKRESRSLTMAAWRYSGGTVSEPGEAEYVDGVEISSELFSILGVSLLRGCAFLPEEDRPGAPPVIIISNGLWKRLYSESPAAIGRPLVFDGKSYTVVGIAPSGFRLSWVEPDVFTPLGQNTARFMQMREAHPGLAVWAGLGPGARLAEAQTELALIGRHLAEQYPKSNAGRGFVAQPLRHELVDELVGDVRGTLWLLLGAVSMVLLIACVNVASLLLARAVAREREFAMRSALGASRSRLVRQCLTESGVLGLSGGLLGVWLAAVGIRPFVAFWPGSLPRAEEVQFDWRVLLFALAASLLSGLLFGLAPALRAPTHDLEQILRAGARTVAGGSRHLHSALVISEISLAVVLLVSAGILGRTLLRLSSVDPGIDTRNLLITRMALSPAVLANPARIRVAWQDVLDRARRVPGVQSVAMVDTVPMREGNNQLGYWTTPAFPPKSQMPLALATSVTPDYLKVMGIPLRQGRFFNDQDRMGNQPVVVIDDVLAQLAFGGRDSVGKRLWVPDMPCTRPKVPQAVGPLPAGTTNSVETVVECSEPYEVVGVVGHVRHWGLASDDQAHVRAQLYYPFAQVPDPFLRRWSELMSIAVRTSTPPLSQVGPVQREVRGTRGDQVLYEVRTMEQLASASLAQQRFLLFLFGIFAGLALLLACIGIYGVLTYVTSQRVPEIGVRMALGASARDVMRMVLGQTLGMIFVGVGVGGAAALVAGRLLERLVAGVRSIEPLTFAMMISVLIAAALFASFLPARRASRIDPMMTLRQE
jgi:putative ABC transport system permease protein